jgi:hypothetical protein
LRRTGPQQVPGLACEAENEQEDQRLPLGDNVKSFSSASSVIGEKEFIAHLPYV